MKNKILKLLKEKNDFISGEEISKEFHMTRAAIWKYMNILKEEGYVINSVPSKGYKLISVPDRLTLEEIEKYLDTEYIGRKIYYYELIDSTNDKAKELSWEQQGTVMVAEEQNNGKGRLGRQWISPRGKGIWMSVLLKPEVDPMKVSKLTLVAAAAIHKAFGNMGISSSIKWPNDIIINNKKVCGILTEMNCELNLINYVVLGIGINVNFEKEDIPADLLDRATSLKIELDKDISRQKLFANILNEFEVLYKDFIENHNGEKTINICRENSILIGKEVQIIRGNDIKIGKAIDINIDGELVIEYENGEIENIYSGEVSIRGLYGYI